ncbi:alpha/beta fold hydrolase [Streptomyces sp. CA-249302]|uniref:alpha/beta fold hydrolase n=1 Tax=Streptomyces sp. CA-249302 TaxID=3240058 RepID=UPI003D8E345E
MVAVLTARLGGDARVPGGRAAAVLGKLALRMTTQPALNVWRGRLTNSSAPALGDILRYQSKGADLRDHLRQHIATEAGPAAPTVLIGHSLGGVALVDLLALSAAQGQPLSGIRLLVTVGSQAPFLHELGALTGLEPGAGLPDGFPRWLNVYDRQDLLAFLAEPIFPADPRVTDHEVVSGQPFPPSHSAYWKTDSLYDGVAEAVAELG